jgi:hypothetical protein
MSQKKYARDLEECLERSPLARVAYDATAELYALVSALPSGEGGRTLRSLQSTVVGVAASIAEGAGCNEPDMQLCRYERARLRALRCEGSIGVLRFANAVAPNKLKKLVELSAAVTRAVTALCESCVEQPVEGTAPPEPARPTRSNGTRRKADHGGQDEAACAQSDGTEPKDRDVPLAAERTDEKSTPPE